MSVRAHCAAAGLTPSSIHPYRSLHGVPAVDIYAKLARTDVTIAEAADQLIRLRAVAGGLSLDDSLVDGVKRQAGIALMTSALDLGAAMGRLNKCDPEHSWVAAHLLHRPQYEHFMRGAFYAGPSSVKEAQDFVRNDRMPKRQGERGLSTITLAQLTEENSAHWQWGSTPRAVLRGTTIDMSGLVHGGKVVVDIYTHGDAIGANKATPEQVCASMNNPLAVSCIALKTLHALSLTSPEREAVEQELDRARMMLGRMGPLSDAELGPISQP